MGWLALWMAFRVQHQPQVAPGVGVLRGDFGGAKEGFGCFVKLSRIPQAVPQVEPGTAILGGYLQYFMEEFDGLVMLFCHLMHRAKVVEHDGVGRLHFRRMGEEVQPSFQVEHWR